MVISFFRHLWPRIHLKKAALICVMNLLICGFLIGLCELTLTLLHVQVKKPNWLMNYWEYHGNQAVAACYVVDPLVIYRPMIRSKPHLYCPGTDQFGFRSQSNNVSGAQKTLVMLGDSFVFGEGVQDDKTADYQLRQLFSEHNEPVNVFNAGVRGYGNDQEVKYFESYILPRIHPDIVVWDIHENDLADNNDGCLYSLKNNALAEVPATHNTLYIMGSIFAHTPQWIRNMQTYWLFMSLIPQRYTIGCTLSADAYQPVAFKKLELLVRRMYDLSRQKHFALLITYTQAALAFIKSDQAVPYPNYVNVDSLVKAVRDGGVTPVLITPEIERTFSMIQPGDSTNTDVLGAMTGNLSTDLFLQNTPPATRHFNAAGNQLFADIMYEKLHEQFAGVLH